MESTCLTCGCCGHYFWTWEGYKDQGQDEGFGICEKCQDSCEKIAEEKYDEIFKVLVEGAGNEKTKKNMKDKVAKDKKWKYVYVNRALEMGIVKYTF